MQTNTHYLTDAQRKSLILSVRKLVLSGSTIRSAAEAVGISVGTISNWKRRFGVAFTTQNRARTSTAKRKFTARARSRH